MSRTRTRSAVRRSLIVVLDGLAIAVLAVLLASSARGETLAGGAAGFVAVAETTVRGWLATPGVGPFEGAAALGLGVAALGVLWYGVGRPVLGRLRRGDERDLDPVEEFEFGRAGSSGRSGAAGRSPFAPPRPDNGHGSGSTKWTQALFDSGSVPSRGTVRDALAAGDFYRSSSRNESVRVEADPVEESPTASEDGAQAFRLPDDRVASPASSAGDEDSVAEPGPDDSFHANGDDVAVDRPRTTDESTADADPLDRLHDAVAEARGSIETVRGELSSVDSDGPVAAERALKETARVSSDRLERLRAALPNGSPDPAASVAAVREDGARLEATLEGAFDGA